MVVITFPEPLPTKGSSVTSSTRPQNPLLNQTWSNPDTGETEYWDGSVWRGLSQAPNIFGTGLDGDKVFSSNTNLDPSVVYNYKDMTINAGVTLGVSSSNQVLIIRCTGNVTINGTINVDEKGGPGGAAVSTSSTNGNNGTDGAGIFSGLYAQGGRRGLSGSTGGGGGGGGSYRESGVAGTKSVVSPGTSGNPGDGGVLPNGPLAALAASVSQSICCGGGGGSGGKGSGSAATVQAGGNGGGAVLIICRGNVTFGGSSVLSAKGGSPSVVSAEGSGGGGGGMFAIFYAGTVTGSATTDVSGGTGSSGVNSANGGNGAPGICAILPIR